jgi:hypothetical protein
MYLVGRVVMGVGMGMGVVVVVVVVIHWERVER